MRFTNGYWLVRDGFQMNYATQGYRMQQDEGSLTALVPCRRVQKRGDTLNGATLTVRFTSPMENVIRVDITHFKGQALPAPQFEITEYPVSPQITIDAQGGCFTSGALSAVLQNDPWEVSFMAEGREITSSQYHGMAHALETATGKTYMSDSLMLDVGECVYGLGERFGPYVKNGQSIDIWNADGGTASEQAYKNVPFYMSNRGYGVFVHSTADVSFEVASEKVERVQFSCPGETLSYYIIYGGTPKKTLTYYTALLGRPALPPAWSFGLWLSTSFTTEYDEATASAFIDGMLQREIPLHVFHFDCFWMNAYRWCDFTWDDATFPDPPSMIRRYQDKGLRLCLWINPYIAQDSPLFDEGAVKGYFLKKTDGSVWQTDLWQAGMALVDFTHPEARRWFCAKLKPLLEKGIDCFKTDFGERIPVRDIVYHDGSNPLYMHNYYAHLYNQTVFDLLTEVRGQGQAVLFARSATAGGQQFPVHWGGDNTATYVSMAETLRAGLSLAHCGFGFWSHDISGFEQTAPADVYKRWVAFGMLSSHSRLHGSESYRVPWLFDDEAVDVVRMFTRLKCSLMPYLYAAAVEAHQQGVPLMRPMHLEFPDDPACDVLDRQYMLGEKILVAPVFSKSGDVSYYLPSGTWTHLLTGETTRGGTWRKETYVFMSLPLWIREGAVIPRGVSDTRPDYDFPEGVTLHVYALPEGGEASAQIPTTDGSRLYTYHVRRENGALTVETDGPKGYAVADHSQPASAL